MHRLKCIYGIAGMQIAYAKRSTHQNEAKMEQKCEIKQRKKKFEKPCENDTKRRNIINNLFMVEMAAI